jgi:hypothetical protein
VLPADDERDVPGAVTVLFVVVLEVESAIPSEKPFAAQVGNREDDRIFGLDGENIIDAGTYTRDRDVLEGGKRDDRLLTDDGDGKTMLGAARALTAA